MKIILKDEVFKLEGNKDVVEKISNILVSKTKDNELLGNMIIDGVEIFEDFEDYILNNIEFIEEIKLNIISHKDLINDVLVSKLDYIEEAEPLLESLADGFYKSPNKDEWNQISDFTTALIWIIETFNLIDKDRNLNDIVSNYEDWNLYAQKVFELIEIIPSLNEAIEDQDSVMIADILSYEIVPVLKDMKLIIENYLKVDLNDFGK